MTDVSKLVLLLLLPLACAELAGPVDLTKHFDNNTVYWGADKVFNYTRVKEDEALGMWMASKDFEVAEHGGTHMDAPYHFNKQGWRIGDIPFQRFFGKAVHVNLADKAAQNPDYVVEPAVFEEWEKTNGKVPEGAIVLLNFNWTIRSDNKEQFLGSKTPLDTKTYHFPGLGAAAAEWLVGRQVYGVGTDAASIDPGTSKDYKAHQVLSQKNIYILEQAALNVTLPAAGFKVLALPMKIRHGTGAPCRLVAMP